MAFPDRLSSIVGIHNFVVNIPRSRLSLDERMTVFTHEHDRNYIIQPSIPRLDTMRDKV